MNAPLSSPEFLSNATFLKKNALKSMNYFTLFKSLVCLIFVSLLVACSSSIPAEIRLEPDGAPNVAKVREQVDLHISQPVRWGGVILNTENHENSSWVTIISQPLTAKGKPKSSKRSEGRFIAIVNGFLEPLEFSDDRQITVTGHIGSSKTQKVGEYMYEYPVVEVDNYYLWPKKVEPNYVNRYTYPYHYYDPWYYPDYYYWPNRYRYPYRLNHYRYK